MSILKELELNSDPSEREDFPDMAKVTLTQRMEAVEAALGIRPKKSPVEWSRDHKLALGILLATVAGLLLLWFTWWQPQHAAHAEQDFNLKTDQRIDSKLRQPIEDIHQIQVDVSKISSRLDELNTLLPSIVQTRWKDGWKITPQSLKQSIPEIKALVAVSQQRDITTVPASFVANTGRSLVPLAIEHPEVWGAAQDVLNYRTDLNRNLQSVQSAQDLATTLMTNAALKTYYDDPFVERPTKVTVGGQVPAGTGVLLETIGHHIEQIRDNELMLVDGGEVRLDGMRMRSIIFRNTIVHYDGGAAILEKVTFVACKFVIANDALGRNFALAVLQASSVDFLPTRF